MSLTNWTVSISAFCGMLSAAIASATYVTTTRQRSRAGLIERAKRIRENIQDIVGSTQSIVREINEGTVLLSAAWSITEALRSRLSDKPDTNELHDALNDEGFTLAVCISGWHGNTSALAFYANIYRLRHIGDGLTGAFKIYNEILELLVSLVRDGYSSTIFKSILDAIAQGIGDFDWQQPYHKALNQLTVRLQSDASLYFVVRYAKATKEIQAMLEYLSKCLINLDDQKFLSIEAMRLHDDVGATTHTSSMRSLIRTLSSVIEPEEANTLLTFVGNIERSIGKEQASAEIDQFKKR